MISVSKIGWSSYSKFEGPFFGGTIKVPKVGSDATFAQKVLSLTAAAEGGSWNAVNMYDSGLVSLGAIQFIDAGSFNVCNMLGYIAEKCGVEQVVSKLKPALDLRGATFEKTQSGNWRFHVDGKPISTLDGQKKLYFGDSNGNLKGTFDANKKNIAKTWAACVASVMEINGAVQAQLDFTMPRLINGFVWGKLKEDLYDDNVPDDGYVGMLRGMLLSFAVNAPALVVKRYNDARTNSHAIYTDAWCLHVLRAIVVGSNIKVWPARWSTKRDLVKSMWGIQLPTWNEISSADWKPTIQEKTAVTENIVAARPSTQDNISSPAPDETQTASVKEDAIVEQDLKDTKQHTETSYDKPGVATRQTSFLSIIYAFVKMILENVFRAMGKNT